MKAILELRNLHFAYVETEPLFHDFSLAIEAGKVYWLAGKNGAGKSTLLKMIMGLLKPSSGEILLDSRDVTGKGIEDRAGFLGLALQNPDLQLFASSVEKELSFGPGNRGIHAVEMEKRIEEALQLFSLESLRGKPPLMEPFGIRKKIALASVYTMDPSLYLLDEPDWSMDHHEREILKKMIKSETLKGKSFIIVSHNRDYMLEVCDSMINLSSTLSWGQASPADFFYQPSPLQEPTDLVKLAGHFAGEQPVRIAEWNQCYRKWREEHDR